MSALIRHDWDLAEIEALLELPLVDLLWRAQQVHRDAHPAGYHVQLASLLSVTGSWIMPLSERLTFRTSLACAAMVMFL